MRKLVRTLVVEESNPELSRVKKLIINVKQLLGRAYMSC